MQCRARWDAFLVQAITSLSKEPLTPQDRQILLDTLLDTRYRFIEEFTKDKGSGDFVRRQFVEAWKRISPVFRTHLSDDPSRSLITYLAFFTASDALVALDSLGPTLGLEVSRNGLIRLARLISEDESITLAYGYGVDQALRATLGLGEALPISAPAFDGESVPLDLEPPPPQEEENFF